MALLLIGKVLFGTLHILHLQLLYYELKKHQISFYRHKKDATGKLSLNGVNNFVPLLKKNEYPNFNIELKGKNKEDL